MKTFRTALLVQACLVYSAGLSAQTISGKLVDEQQQPLPYANVVVLSLPDSAFVAGTISGEDGTFRLNATADDQLLRISSIGYSTVYRPVIPSDLGIVQLVADAQLLSEVVVKGTLPVTRIKGDAMVTSVANSVLSKAGSANDVLGQIPGITKKQDAFEVFGKGSPLIYVNGRKLNDLSELEQLNSDEIKSVEVIRNPGSRYDATVKAVVRIQTIRRKGDGFGFSLRSSYYQSDNTDWIEQGNFNYRHNNLDIFGGLNYTSAHNWQKATIEQAMQGTKLWEHEENTYYTALSNRLNGHVGFNYQFNENHVLGAKYATGKYLYTRENALREKNIDVDNAYFGTFSKYHKISQLIHTQSIAN